MHSLHQHQARLRAHSQAGPRTARPACPTAVFARSFHAHNCRKSGLAALPGSSGSSNSAIDIRQLSDLITSQAVEDAERQHVLESIAGVLEVPVAAVKNMAYKQKALLTMDAAEIKRRVEKVADVVEVPYAKALKMVTIQPSLLTDTDTQAEALRNGLRVICYDLKAPKDEIVDLIIANPSVLHGRQMRLSVADMAHLAMLREPKGRVAE